MRLIDAARCPYCARVRIALAEKSLEAETVEIDLADRPQWLLDLNPPNGRVPVLDDGFTLPESEVIMEYLEDRYPDPPLLPTDPTERARARLLVQRFDDALGRDYYAFRRHEPNELAKRLEALEVGHCLYADIAYVPWVMRAREMLDVKLPQRIESWLEELTQRSSIAREHEVVRSL